MEKKRIKCPKCGSVLDISFENNGEGIKHITCPVCNAKLKVNLEPQHGGEGKKPKPEKSESETVIYKPQQRVTTFRIVYNGIPFGLADGKNTIGRKANSSTAKVQIPTPDMTTSRSHMMIEIRQDANGVKYATLVNDSNTNPTLVNGVEIGKGDVIKLSDGDQIAMGETTMVVFEAK